MSQTTPFCGHFQSIERSELEELFSEVAAVRAQNENLFNFTHRPITVYPSIEAGDDDPTEVSEQKVLSEFTPGSPQNQVTVIEGDTGTGKSELCAYLVHQFRKQDRPILRVDKDDDLMSILTTRLPDFYQQHMGEEMPSVTDFERLERNIRDVPWTVAGNATTQALLRFDKQNIDLDYTEQDEQEVSHSIEDQLEQLVTRGEYGKDKNLVTPELYDRTDCLNVFGEPFDTQEAVEIWNEELWAAIREEYETPQLSDILRRVGEAFTDQRPVIVFEDFSIAAIEARQLRNYMEDDPEDNWDFIIAGTRDVTEVLHTATAEARFSFYQTNEPDSNSVLFLDESSAVEFIRPYLGYIKHRTGDGSLSYNRDNGTLTLQEPESGSICAECGLCSSEFRDLYPFNATFLQRIFTGLDESDRSPRKYVTKVFEILDEFYSGAVTAPSSATALGSEVTNPEAPADDVWDRAENFAELAKWYGEDDDDVYLVPAAFVTAFDLDPSAYSDIGIITTNGVLEIPATEGFEPPPCKKPNCKGRTEKSLVERRHDELKGEVDDWISDPHNDKFSETHARLTDALDNLIEHVTGDYRLFTDGKLRYNLSQNQSPYVLENITEAPNEDQIILDQEEFRRATVRRLLKYGIRLDVDDADPDTAALLNGIGTQITSYGREWRGQVIQTYIESDRVLYRSSASSKHDFDDFIIAAYAWLVMLDDPTQPITAERLNERFTSGEPLSVDEHLDQELRIHLSHDKKETLKTLFEYAERIGDLVDTRFGITSNSLDLPRVRNRLSTPPYEILEKLAKTRIENIQSRVRFSSSAKLPDIAAAFYECTDIIADATQDIDNQYKGIEKFVIGHLRKADMEEVQAIADNLNALNGVDSEFNTSVHKFAQRSQSEVNHALKTAQFAERLLEETPSRQDQIHAGLTRMALGSHPAFELLLELDDNWTTPSDTGDGTWFTQVGEKYVN